jgi:hypothetical protein
MPKKTNHAYSTSTSGPTNALAPEVANRNQGRRMLAVSAVVSGTLTLMLTLMVLAPLGFGVQNLTATKKSYIQPLTKKKSYIQPLASKYI